MVRWGVATYIEQSLAKLKEFEGSVAWMYLDTVGKVTVGVGRMLPDAGAAQALPFQTGGRAAPSAEIAEEFARVAGMATGKSAEFYRRAGSPMLPEDAIDADLRRVLVSFESKVRAAMRNYDAYPSEVKVALLDMAYNLGPAGLLAEYPRLIDAVQAGHWSRAANECMRHGPSALRNAWTREQFLRAVVGSIKAEAESWRSRTSRWLRGLWR